MDVLPYASSPPEALVAADDVELNDTDSDLDEKPDPAPDASAPLQPIDPKVMAAVRRLHNNTGHRSNRRLARALVIAGAPAEAVRAAKHLKCEVCHERQRPKTRRPATCPRPRDVGDVVFTDLVQVEDAIGGKHWVVHATDGASRFQSGKVLRDKSSASVIDFFNSVWIPVFGAPGTLVCDMGTEFVSSEFEEYCSSFSIYLHPIAVEAPWQNGIAERSGGILKVILQTVCKKHSIVTREGVQQALAEALSAYNLDVNESGFSPSQWAIGRNPRVQGDLLGGALSTRLAEHSILDRSPSYVARLAMRQTAREAMTRLRFSQSLSC
jgi:hypothetical protein